MKLSKTRTALGFGTGVCSVAAIIPLLFANFGGEIHTSKQGLEIIGDAEGCRRDPYKCPADVLTVGVGSTAASGEKIDPKHRYSDLEIAERWKNDIVIAEQCVNKYGHGKQLPQPTLKVIETTESNTDCGSCLP